jgi:hypothetical protein
LYARTIDSLSKNLLHGLAFGELIDELVQLSNPLHQWIFDLFHADAAYHASGERPVRMDRWRSGKEGFEVSPLFDLLIRH